MPTLNITGRALGPGHPCFVIAEAGVNHNGDPNVALQLIEAAAKAGADAVKFQTFTAQRLVSPSAPKALYQAATTGSGESQFHMLRRLELSAQTHQRLMAESHRRGILFLSSPFDEDSANLLDQLGVPAFKIASGELTNWPLLAHIARKGKPIILSTGMSSLPEVREAVRVIRETGHTLLALLHCVSNYPADPRDANLRAMHTMTEAFGVPVGFSDHTPGIDVALAAVALGACVIEKHLTLDRGLPGPDHRASLEPKEFLELVQGIRLVECALGHGRKEPAASEAATVAVVRKSLVSACDIGAGATLTRELITIKRPGTGLPPSALESVIGRTVRTTIPVDTVLRCEMLA